MAGEYSMVQGRFGTLEVVELTHDLAVHAHEQIQFGFWLRGGQAHSHVGSKRAEYSDATVVGVNRYQSHDFKLNDGQAPAVILFLNVHLAWLDEITRDGTHPIVLTESQIVSTPEIRAAAELLMQQVIQQRMPAQHLDHQTLELDVWKLLNLILHLPPIHPLGAFWTPRRKRLDHRVRRALMYMESHLQPESNIAQLTLSVGVSRSRLFELFQSELDSSPQVIWSSIRLKQARQKLAMTTEPLSIVAASLGYSNAGNFARAFRNAEGISASHYRQQNLHNKQQGEQLCAVTYTSRASHAISQSDLDQLLLDARARNQGLNITGVLLYVEGCFMQYLEGPRSSLWEVLNLITQSHHHHHLNLGDMSPIQQRAYPLWQMCCVTRQTEAAPKLLHPDLQQFLFG